MFELFPITDLRFDLNEGVFQLFGRASETDNFFSHLFPQLSDLAKNENFQLEGGEENTLLSFAPEGWEGGSIPIPIVETLEPKPPKTIPPALDQFSKDRFSNLPYLPFPPLTPQVREEVRAGLPETMDDNPANIKGSFQFIMAGGLDGPSDPTAKISAERGPSLEDCQDISTKAVISSSSLLKRETEKIPPFSFQAEEETLYGRGLLEKEMTKGKASGLPLMTRSVFEPGPEEIEGFFPLRSVFEPKPEGLERIPPLRSVFEPRPEGLERILPLQEEGRPFFEGYSKYGKAFSPELRVGPQEGRPISLINPPGFESKGGGFHRPVFLGNGDSGTGSPIEPLFEKGVKEGSSSQGISSPPRSDLQPDLILLSSPEKLPLPKEERASIFKPYRVELLERITRIIEGSGQRGEERIEMRLEPPELGHLFIKITKERDAVKATLWAENQMTKELLEAHRAELRRMLGEDGLRLERFEVLVPQDIDLTEERQGFSCRENPWRERGLQEERRTSFCEPPPVLTVDPPRLSVPRGRIDRIV